MTFITRQQRLVLIGLAKMMERAKTDSDAEKILMETCERDPQLWAAIVEEDRDAERVSVQIAERCPENSIVRGLRDAD